MSPLHTSAHEALLDQVLSGERSIQDAELRQLLESCSVCGQDWRELQATTRRLQAAATDQAADRRLASELDQVPGLEGIADQIEQLAATPAAPAVPATRTGLRLLSAAALLIAALLWWQAGEGDRPEPDTGLEIPLGSNLTCSSPTGAGSDFSRFEWLGELPAGSWFEVQVWPGSRSSPDQAPLLHSGKLRVTFWEPSTAELDRLPVQILWEVHLRQADTLVAADRARAARR